MTDGFNFAPARLVRGDNAYDSYISLLNDLFVRAKARASEIWPGFTFGGRQPEGKQYGITSFRPRDLFGGGTSTFSKTFGSQGSWANIFSYTVPEDEVHAFAGLSFTEPALIFAQLRWEIEDRKYPIIDIEEAQGWGMPFSLLFNQDKGKELVVPEEQAVLFRGFQERTTRNRVQRVVPLGFVLYKNKDLVIREQETGN